MPIDLTALEKQRAMLDDIIRLASDPEAARLLEQVVVSGKSTKEPQQTPAASETKAPLLFPSDRAASNDIERGSQVAAVRKAITLRNGDFTVDDVGSDLRARGMDIDNIAVGKVLRRLATKGELRVTQQGAGSNPNRYEKTERFRSAA